MPFRHQLNIHLDYSPNCFGQYGLEISYGYNYREHHLREQIILIGANDLEPELKMDLDSIYQALTNRIPEPEAIRLPHAKVKPKIIPAILTFVVLDQTRAKALPIARLTYYEEVEPTGSRIERRIYLEKPDWTDTEYEVCKRVREKVRKITWKDYQHLMGNHLFGVVENGA